MSTYSNDCIFYHPSKDTEVIPRNSGLPLGHSHPEGLGEIKGSPEGYAGLLPQKALNSVDESLVLTKKTTSLNREGRQLRASDFAKTTADSGKIQKITLKRTIVRIQAQVQENSNDKSPVASNGIPKKPVLHTGPVNRNGNSQDFRVKTFEEIMHDKRLRQQRLEEAAVTARSNNSAQSATEPGGEPRVKKRPTIIRRPVVTQAVVWPVREASAMPESSVLPCTTPQPQAASPAPADMYQQSSSQEMARENSPVNSPTPKPRTTSGVMVPVQRVEEEEDVPTVTLPGEPWPKKAKKALKNSRDPVRRTKVKKQVKRKLTLVGQVTQVKPGKKKKAGESQCLVFMALRTPNTAPAEQAEQSQEPPCKRVAELSTSPCKTKMHDYQRFPASPMATTGSGTNIQPVKVQMYPACELQSSAVGTSARNKVWEPNLTSAPEPAASCSPTKYDFDELMNEFLGYYDEFQLQLDPKKSTEDLCLELEDAVENCY